MKHKYLFRLMMITILMLFVPIMIVTIVFWRNSLKELEMVNDTYNEKMLDAYANVLNKRVTSLREYAGYISTKSKESDSEMFDGVQGLDEDYYRLYQISQELIDMNLYINASDWGIYLYDIDKILKPGVSTNVDNIIFEMEEQNLDSSGVKAFFSIDNYKWAQETFCAVGGDNHTGSLLMGVHTYIGAYNDEALVYFVISPQEMEDAMTIMDEGKTGFYLYNETEQKIMLSWGNYTDTVTDNLHKKETIIPGFSIVANLSEDTLQENLYEYASNTGRLMMTLGVGLFACGICAVYISYKPIKQLTVGLEYENEEEDKKGDEIATIKQAMQRDRSKIEQQENAIKDLLLSNLLYGGHISSDRIKHLGIDDDMKYYAVFLLSGYVLNSDVAKEISSAAINQFDSRLFVLSLANQNRSAFVLFSKAEDVSEVRTYLKEWLAQHEIAQNSLHSGKVVDKMDDILLSFRAAQAKEKRALEIEHAPEAVSTKAEKQKKLMDDILDYLELNYRDANLGQMQVADTFQMSNSTLSRMFKSHMGVGFAEYLIAKRLEYAKQLLIDSNYSINDIATMSGFSSVHYFSRMFKTYQEMTPSAYRKENVQNTQD